MSKSFHTCVLLILLLHAIQTFSAHGRLLTEVKSATSVGGGQGTADCLTIAPPGNLQQRALKAVSKDQRPTIPGGSPGVGHSIHNKT